MVIFLTLFNTQLFQILPSAKEWLKIIGRAVPIFFEISHFTLFFKIKASYQKMLFCIKSWDHWVFFFSGSNCAVFEKLEKPRFWKNCKYVDNQMTWNKYDFFKMFIFKSWALSVFNDIFFDVADCKVFKKLQISR